jgi:hypothetical protein
MFPFQALIKKKAHSFLNFSFSVSKQETAPGLSYYKNKRIYKNKSKLDLMNQLMINELCRHEIFVRNSLTLYHLARRCFGISYKKKQKHINV